MANFFDQFDTAKETKPTVNFFDQFDTSAVEEPKKVAVPVKPEARPEDQSFLRQVADVPLKTSAGVVTGIRMIADATGADSSVSKNLRGVEDWIADLYSAQSKKDSREIARIMKEAEDKGVADQVLSAVKAFSVAPVDMVANALGTAAPAITAGLATTLFGAPTAVATGVGLGIGSIMGAGTVKGSIYDATKQALQENTSMPPKEIEARAALAQEYGGKNLDQILMGAGLGAIGAASGVEPALARQLAKGIATKEATKAVVKEAAAKETALAAERGVVKNAAITGAKEFAQEGLQGGQEQAAQNVALQRMGFDVPTMRGVVGQGALEGLAGLGMGAAGGAREAYKAKRELAADTTKPGDLQGRFTTAKEEEQRAGKGFDQESADTLMPATDAAGNPLVGGVAAPAVTITPPPAPEPKKPKTTGIALDTAEAATSYIDAIDAGTQKPNTMQLNALMKNLGITAPEKGAGYVARSVEAIKTHLAQQGAPSVTGTEQPAAGTSATVAGGPDTTVPTEGTTATDVSGVGAAGTNAAPTVGGAGQQPSTLTQEGTPSGTQTPQAQQAKAQGQEKPAAGTVGLGDLSPEMQEQIQSRRDKLYELESEGAPPKRIANAYAVLNKMETELGLDITKPSTLSAKRTKEGYLPVSQLIEEGSQATATAQDRTPAYEGTDVQAAMELGQKYEKQQEEEERTAYEASLGKGESRYSQENLPPNTEENYEAVAEEHNSNAEAANATRAKLSETFKSLTAEHKAARDEVERLEDEIEKAERANDQKKLDSLREQENEANRRESDLLEKLIEAETALKEHGPEQNMLKPWYKLTAADKDIYFENIKNNTPAEHRQAAAALLAEKNKAGVKSREGEGRLAPAEQRIARSYEQNRAQMGKIFGIKFPSWDSLSTAAKNAYLKEIVNNAGLQQDRAFAKLGLALLEEQKKQAESRKNISALEAHQRRVRVVAERRRRLDERLKRNYERLAPKGVGGVFLPKNVIAMIQNGDLQGVLQYLSDKLPVAGPKQRIFKAVAQSLLALKLNTKIRMVDELPNGDLAQYDPVEDVILVTPSGMTAATVLHEIVHAGTAKIINLYNTKQFSQLTEAQIRAVEHLEELMYEVSGALAENHPNAFEQVGKREDGTPRYSLMEFLAYALTDENLQVDLALLEPKDRVVTTNLPEAKNMWSKIARAIAGIIGLDKVYFLKEKVREDAPYNYLLEISSSFGEILAKPTEPIFLSKFSAKQPAAAPKQAEEFRESGLNEDDSAYKLSEKENPTKKRGAVWRALTTREGWRNTVRNIQDKSYHARSLYNKLDMAGKINRDMSGAFNNADEHGDLATGEARQFATDYLQEPQDSLRQTFQNWMQLTNQKLDKALEQFHKLAEMFHEPERRHVKWVVSVPLSTTQNLTHNGKPISAAERRIAILGDARTGKPGLIHKVELTQQQQQALWQELETLGKNHADPLGDSPRISEKMRERFAKPGSKHKGIDINEDAPIYNALGIEKATVDKRMAEFNAKGPEERALIEKMFAEVKAIADATAKLNKIGNYWSTPVSNLVGMYDYTFYMPFKGLSKHTLADDLIDFDSKSNGKELQELEHAADGRFAVSDNPILQLMNDAYRSAGRAGRRNYTQAIKNSLEKSTLNPNGTGVIPGKVVKTIKFEERNIVDLTQFKGGANIFHYNPDGSIDILRINEPKILNALRYSFRDANPMLDMANAVTGFFGAMHTRYNYNFAPLNFVRDALTNAWNIGASRQLGPVKSLQYLGSISTQVVKNGLGKAMEVALLEEKGDATSKKILLDAAAKDPFVRDMLEYLRFGGKTTYLEGFSLKSNLEQLSKNTVGRNRIIGKYDDYMKLIDSWNNMFEFTSRTAAYRLYKEEALKRQIDAGVSDTKGPQGQMSPAERAAATEAAAWVKNLANFEKVGEYGRAMGALYMFSRPSATGAVRAVEAILPAFTTEGIATRDIPPQIANDPAAKAKYIENFKRDRRNAQIMAGALLGMGYATYLMSMLSAPDDEWKRNNTKTDNMEQWTRFARFHIPNEVSQKLGIGKDVVFQVPWGFGLGSFAASGAQIGGMIHGTASVKEGLSNIAFTIMTDAFLPIPVSKIPFTDAPLNWFIDSVSPTVLRPMIEFIANKNGIGQTINSASMRRMGDAFTGGDRIPEIYKDASKELFRKTDGFIDWSPNTVYFFANSYLDGVSKLAESSYSWASLEKGEKAFNIKTDAPLFGSFFGAKTNVDSREYGKVEEKIKEIDKRLESMKKDDPTVYASYVSKNPLHPSVVSAYQAQQGELNALRQKATEIRNLKGLSPKQRDEILKIVTLEQNMVKHRMVTQFKAMGMEP